MNMLTNIIFVSMIILNIIFLMYWNVFQKKLDYFKIKNCNLFTNGILTASLVVIHFPVTLLNIVYFFPLLHNSIGILNLLKKK
jgi:hypothetical protein